MKSTTAFVRSAEEVADSVAASVVQNINTVIEALMPDGRPFGMEPRTLEQQVQDYLASGWRDDPEVVKNWIREKATQTIPNLLQQFGVTPDKIAAVHPWDIAEVAAIAHSYKMEKLIARDHAPHLKAVVAIAAEVA